MVIRRTRDGSANLKRRHIHLKRKMEYLGEEQKVERAIVISTVGIQTSLISNVVSGLTGCYIRSVRSHALWNTCGVLHEDFHARKFSRTALDSIAIDLVQYSAFVQLCHFHH